MTQQFRSLYPEYDVLQKWDSPSWNDITRSVIAKRLHEIPTRRFFSEAEWMTLSAVCDRVMPQPERSDPVPIMPWLDAKLYKHQGTGTRYACLPPQEECWKRGAAAIESEAQHRYGRAFHVLDPVEQDLILRGMNDEQVESPAWSSLPSKPFFRHVLLRGIVQTYYAHPAAWNEIGFGGPASPRGYVRLSANRRDPWDGEEGETAPVHQARAS